jgi:putative flippase GtrA
MLLRRFVRFNVASFAGVGVQLAVLWLLTVGLGLHYQIATLVAVTTAVAHNFLWHWRWTWADRPLAPRAAAGAFARFAMSNGVVSLTVNLLLMPVLVTYARLPLLAASLVAIAGSGLANFYLADVVAFRRG